MSQVVIIKCNSYEQNEVDQAVKRGLELLGGLDKFVNITDKVLLKPNLLIGDPPEKCVTTHPTVFKAVAKQIQVLGAKVKYGDSPAFGAPEGVAKKAGLKDVADELGLEMADFVKGREVRFPKGRQNKKFVIAEGVLEADKLISLPKLKTHGLQKLTCCVKNQFGCVPGILKGEFHVKLPDANDFAKMLLDLNTLVNPALYIVDGIYAMEGNGPRGGTPRKMGIILMSADPIAIDASICRLVNVNPDLVPTIKYGAEWGLGVYKKDDIELLGDSFEEVSAPNFVIDRESIKPYTKKKGLRKFLSNYFVAKPVIKEKKCVKCGICVDMCPARPKALIWEDRKMPPIYDYSNCIRCYCCQEICPKSAIVLKKPWLRLLFRR